MATRPGKAGNAKKARLKNPKVKPVPGTAAAAIPVETVAG